MFDQDILVRPTSSPLNMRSVKLNIEAPYRRVGSAIDGDPRDPDARAQIIAVNDTEYLVPEERTHEAGELVSVSFRLDQARKILNRPDNTRRISEMALSSDVSAHVRAALTRSVEQDNPPIHDYKVLLIQPNL